MYVFLLCWVWVWACPFCVKLNPEESGVGDDNKAYSLFHLCDKASLCWRKRLAVTSAGIWIHWFCPRKRITDSWSLAGGRNSFGGCCGFLVRRMASRAALRKDSVDDTWLFVSSSFWALYPTRMGGGYPWATAESTVRQRFAGSSWCRRASTRT